ncbi:MAG: HAMP domain-containing histidine kinase [Phycisphaerales bacterium]|nr:HAMP domain-containing histidine kinase [Phycisphaerales bacterium]
MSAYKATLRLKLTLWFLVIFAVVFLALLAAVWQMHRRTGREAIETHLEGLAEGVAGDLRDADARLGAVGLVPFQPVDRTFAILAVRDGSGGVIASRWRVDTEVLPALDAPANTRRIAFHRLSGERASRLLGRPLETVMITYRYRTPAGEVRYLDLANLTDLGAAESAFLYDVLLVGALGALLAAAVASWVIAGRAVTPLRQIGEAAKRLDPDHVQDRIAVESPDPEVERLQTELNEALSRIEEGYRAQERFISNVAHDLKTPISVMLAESQVWKPRTASREEINDYRESMIDEMQRLGGMVEGFLTLARADQGEALARMTDVALNDLVVEAVSECDIEAARQHVRLLTRLEANESRGEDAVVRGDPDLLRTMLVNLLRNAVRHSPAGESVRIATSHANGRTRISVQDAGPGVPEEFRHRIFDRFVQVPGNDGSAGGMGLGLAIAMSVARMHGGGIEVHNCRPHGCVFVVDLPRAAEEEAKDDEAAGETRPGSG